MRKAVLMITCALLVTGALSAVVATATVRFWRHSAWTAQRPEPAADPKESPSPEQSALEFFRRTAAADWQAVQAMTTTVDIDDLRRSITALVPSAQRAGRLPGATGSSGEVLVWVRIPQSIGVKRVLYNIRLDEGMVTKVTGPIVPLGGYRSLSVTPLDEDFRPVSLNAWHGRSLVLVAPRRPEAGLAEALVQLRRVVGPKGVEVVLVTDMGSPDWAGTARAAGFDGPVWRLKLHMEEVSVVTPGSFLGAVGLLIDPEGDVVASWNALDPRRYGLPNDVLPSASDLALRAYGLIR